VQPLPPLPIGCRYYGPQTSEETSVESMSELLDELERVRDRQERIIALLRKSSLRPDVRFTLDAAIKEAEHDLDGYNALLTRYGRSGN
jgi:hypothetical protein